MGLGLTSLRRIGVHRPVEKLLRRFSGDGSERQEERIVRVYRRYGDFGGALARKARRKVFVFVLPDVEGG